MFVLYYVICLRRLKKDKEKLGEEEPIKRIIIAEKGIYGDLKKCYICNINFTAIQPCIICGMIIEKENEVGRKLTKEEFDGLFEWLK